MTDSLEVNKEDLEGLESRIHPKFSELQDGIRNINDVSQNLNEKVQIIEAEINSTFDRIQKIIQARRTKLLNELKQKEVEKQKVLVKQKDELERILNELNTKWKLLESSSDEKPENNNLMERQHKDESLVKFCQMQVETIPAENNHLVFQTGNVESFEKNFQSWGSIFSSGAISNKTTAYGDGIKQTVVGQIVVATIATKDWQGKITPGPGVENFLCEIIPINVSHSSESPIQLTTELTDMDNGTHELTYILPFEGQYELSIKLFDNPIDGSPFKVCAVKASEVRPLSKIRTTYRQRPTSFTRPSSAKSFVVGGSTCSRNNPIEDDLMLKVGSRGRGRGQFANPQGVGVGESGVIIVTDSNNQCVQCFGSQVGECRLKFGVRGRSLGQMQRPAGVAAFQNGNIAIADYENKCVSVYDSTGKFVNRIGAGKLLGPKGLAVDKSGQLVVVDSKQSCIFVFQPSGKFVVRFGARGSDPAKLAAPQFVAVNSQGDIIVSDFHNHAIKVFSKSGDLIFAFGSNGEGNGQFNAPTGVGVDSQDNIIVADWGNSRIQIFDSQGSFLSFVNTLAYPLYGPQGLSVTPDGHIVVADSGNHCFKIYKYLQ